MHPFGRWLACGILGLVLAVEAHGQEDVRYDADAEQAFQAAVQAYRGGAYRSAERQFDSVARAFPSSHRITAALVMRAKALFRLEENYEAVKAVRAFLAAHPASLYVPDAEVVLARVYLRINREEEARDAALRALHSLPEAPSGRLEQEVEAVLDTALSAVDLPALQTLIARTSGRRERGQLWRVVADRELSRGNARAAAVALDSLTARYAGVVRPETIERIRSGHTGEAVRLGVLLPLMRGRGEEPRRLVGGEVYEGVLAAYDRFHALAKPGPQISLEMRDTDREGGVAIDMARQLSADPAVVGILGPVFSNTTISAARVAAASRVPLVTPTANQNGIAALGEAVFQANPDYDQRGKAMARYAVQLLGLHVLATLSPSDTYAKFLADAFAREARALGAVVAAQELVALAEQVVPEEMGEASVLIDPPAPAIYDSHVVAGADEIALDIRLVHGALGDAPSGAAEGRCLKMIRRKLEALGAPQRD